MELFNTSFVTLNFQLICFHYCLLSQSALTFQNIFQSEPIPESNEEYKQSSYSHLSCISLILCCDISKHYRELLISSTFSILICSKERFLVPLKTELLHCLLQYQKYKAAKTFPIEVITVINEVEFVNHMFIKFESNSPLLANYRKYLLISRTLIGRC